VLSVYRRHKKDCEHAGDRFSKKCRCALWLTGTLFGKSYRKPAKTRSFEAAEKIKRKLENGEEPRQRLKTVTVKVALDAFIKDCESRNLNRSTLGKYKRLRTSLELFAVSGGAQRTQMATR
jgi:hypothetical protein